MSNTLQHHGVLGMKWGVRRTEAQLARASGKKTSDSSDTKNMSDTDLRNKINRLQMEKQYKQLTKELNSGAVAKGEQYVNTALKVIGTAAVTSTAVVTLYNNSKVIREVGNKIIRR